MSCNLYADLRNELFIKAQYSHDIFLEWSMDDRFNYLMLNSKIVRHTAKACHLVLQRRELQTFSRQTWDFCAASVQCWTNVEDVLRFDIGPALYRCCAHVLCLLVLWPVRTACIRLNRVWFYVCSITVLPLWSVYAYVVSVLTRAVFRVLFHMVMWRGVHTPTKYVCGASLYVGVWEQERTDCTEVYARQARGIESVLVQCWAASLMAGQHWSGIGLVFRVCWAACIILHDF